MNFENKKDETFKVHGGKLVFEVNSDASNITWYANGLPTCSPKNCDFWRVHLDDGMQKDLTVHSRDQKGTVCGETDNIVITYKSLIAEDDTEYKVVLKIYMKTVGEVLECYAEVENCDEIRVNEVQCPFVELSYIADRERANDILYYPEGVGRRMVDPWNYVRNNSHTEYMASEYENIWQTWTYPFPLSMSWLGIQSGDNLLYMARYDEEFRTCSFAVGTSPRNTPAVLIPSISHYPVTEKGEKITCGKGVIALLEGTWKTGADLYRKCADNWYNPQKPVEWVKSMTGWQRVILKHQFGKIFFKYKDLLQLYLNGKKYGLDTLIVFGWWKGRFDNGYPIYEPDEALGGAEELKSVINQIQQLGGRVILYNNGVLIDVKTDFYKNEGYQYTKKNIDGEEYREYYQFSNNGMMLKTFGYKAFSSACHGTEGWKNKLIENAKIKLEFNPDSIFFDQLGGHLPRFCFDATHKHKNRCDMDAVYKKENVEAIREILPEGKCIGTENVLDALAPYFDYCHGCLGTWFDEFNFPSMYRYVFPETIITNRLIHDEKTFYQHHLAFAFVNGLRFDVSVYRGRETDIIAVPNYAEYLSYLLTIKQHYCEFFYDGVFIGDDVSVKKPLHITANLFRSNEGKELLVLWNSGHHDETVEAYSVSYTLAANEFRLILLDDNK
jgi:hypothetical protein